MKRFGPLRWLGGVLLENWGTKATAIVLAIVFFMVTRDDVSREFIIPLRVIPDPDRVLLTDLPETVTVELHGSWARINRLAASDLGVSTLDLREAEPGPLEIDPAAIVMPQGVLFRNIVYDRVDLRFDPVVERDFPVKAEANVDTHADYERVSTSVDPPRVRLRGGRSALQEISTLHTEPIERTGVTASFEVTKSVLLPREGVSFAGVAPGDRPQVKVKVTVRPKYGERRIEVPLPVNADAFQGISSTFSVVLRGPLPDLRALDEAGVRDPIVARAHMDSDPSIKAPSTAIVVDFNLTDQVPDDLRASLTIEPERKRFIVRPTPQ